jgi:hypothetical protein
LKGIKIEIEGEVFEEKKFPRRCRGTKQKTKTMNKSSPTINFMGIF